MQRPKKSRFDGTRLGGCGDFRSEDWFTQVWTKQELTGSFGDPYYSLAKYNCRGPMSYSARQDNRRRRLALLVSCARNSQELCNVIIELAQAGEYPAPYGLLT
jgi:hypothetical protein